MGRSKRVLVFVIVAAAPTALACNAILGIDDFKRTECGIGPCPFDDGGPDVDPFDRFVPDSGNDTGTDAPPGVGPVSWAAFEMPNYSLDSGLGDAAPRPLEYNVIDPDQVEDDWTKLVWRRLVIGAPAQPFGEQRTQDAARAECQKLANGPWRLPKRIELVTLLSHGGGTPFIDRSIFTNFPQDAKVWTSSEVRPLNGQFWAVDFQVGSVVQLDQGFPAKVLCVKDKQ